MSESVRTTIEGRELVVTPAPFREANALNKAIGKAIRGADLAEIPTDVKKDMSAGEIRSVVELVLSVAVDDEVERLAFECGKRATYGDRKITPELFDEVEMRGAYYQIMAQLIQVNVAPFFGGLFSALSTLVPPTTEKSRKQK